MRVNHGKRAYCQVDTFGKLGCPEFTMALPCHSPVYCGLVLCDRVKLMVLPSVHPELPFSSILDNLRDKCKQRLLDNLHVTDAMHHNAIFLKCRGKQRNNINKMQMKNNERIFDFRVKQHTGQRSLNTVKWELREITEGLCALRHDSAFIHDHTFANALTKS